MRGLEQEYGERITFVRINIHNPENQPLMDRFGFTTTPELYLVDAEDRLLGAWGEGVTAEELRLAFDEALDEQR